MTIEQKIKRIKIKINNVFHMLLSGIYDIIIILELIGIICYIAGSFCSNVRSYYFIFWKDFIKYVGESNAVTTFTIILSLSVAIFSMLLSIDSNSILLKLNNKEIKAFVNRIGISFILTIYLICIMFINDGEPDLFLINDACLFLLVSNILIIMIQLYILIYGGISKKISNVRLSTKASKENNDKIMNIVQSIYEKQRDQYNS